jgi:hypothetical protein
MLSMLSPGDWLRLLAAFVLFLGPGLALLTWYPPAQHFDRTTRVVVGFCLSLAAWAVLLAWLQLLPSG